MRNRWSTLAALLIGLFLLALAAVFALGRSADKSAGFLDVERPHVADARRLPSPEVADPGIRSC